MVMTSLLALLVAPCPALSEFPDGARVATMLEARCASCHAEGSGNPKALRAWSGARDLAGTASNPDLIVRGHPDESPLITIVESGEMPPRRAGLEQVTGIELGELRAWVASGARFDMQESVASRSATVSGAGHSNDVWNWLGRFHPTLVHFPIALWFAALAAELAAKLAGRPALRGAADFCMIFGALSGVLSATLGWLLAFDSSVPAFELVTHRWLGIAVASSGVGAFVLCRIRPRSRLVVLVALAALVGAAGHTGGLIAYGEDWLTPPWLLIAR